MKQKQLPNAVLCLLSDGRFAEVLESFPEKKEAKIKISIDITGEVHLPKGIAPKVGEYLEFNRSGTPIKVVSADEVSKIIKEKNTPKFNTESESPRSSGRSSNKTKPIGYV